MLSVAELREHISSSLGDEALQRLLDAAYASIDAFLGTEGSATELLAGDHRYVILGRPAESITSVVEGFGATSPTTIATDDYLLHPGGYILERIVGGTTSRSRWRGRVQVTYRPRDDEAIRDVVAIDLINLDLNTKVGVTMEQVGAWMRQFGNNKTYDQLRDEVLARLASDPSLVVV